MRCYIRPVGQVQVVRGNHNIIFGNRSLLFFTSRNHMRIDIRHHNIDIRPHRFPLPIAKNHLKTVPQHHCVLGNDKTIFNFPFQHNLHIHSFYQIPVGITYPRTNLNLSAFIDQGIDLRHIPVKYFFIIDKRNNLHPLFQCNFLDWQYAR